MGFKMSLDDFGTEYSSLNYLSKLPFDTLKIDKSYVDNLCDNMKDKLIIKNLILLAKDLEIDIVAEGIESQNQRDQLIEFGCQYGQGYLLSRPQWIEDILKEE
jgi:EAL domain-containing protein (putative c-di-GMP-specific phosphodiesterase class I)